MTGRELDGGNDNKKPKQRVSQVIWTIGVFFFNFLHVFVY